jgi:hypothetical protein
MSDRDKPKFVLDLLEEPKNRRELDRQGMMAASDETKQMDAPARLLDGHGQSGVAPPE